MLGQMGGPVPFGYMWLAVDGPVLLLAMFVVKTRTFISAVVCGLIFSIPIAAFCWILPTMDSQLDYFREMRGEAVFTVVGSVVLMVVATFHRQ